MLAVSENEARSFVYCPACGKEKDSGLVVCWECFKYSKDFTPLKYYQGSFENWLAEVWNENKGGAK